MTLTITSATRIVGDPKVGDAVDVIAEQRDTALNALTIVRALIR